LEGDSSNEDDPERVPIRWSRKGLWRFEGFFNQSIAYGIVRKGIEAGTAKDVYWTDLGPLASALLRGINQKSQMTFLDAFLTHHSNVIAEKPRLADLYFPKELGGCGVPIPQGEDYETVQHGRIHKSLLLKKRKQAAYLTTHADRRLLVPSLGPKDTGKIARAITHVRESGPERIVRPNYYRKLDLGLDSTQLLSRVIQEFQRLDYYEDAPQIEVKISEGTWKGRPSVTQSTHFNRNIRLLKQYEKFTRQKSGTADYILEPMGIRKILDFKENQMLDTLWPVTHSEEPERLVDEFVFMGH